MQNNPLQKIGVDIQREYDSWLLADIAKGMGALFSLAADVQRIGGDFVPDWAAGGRTQLLLDNFTAGFIPVDLFPKTNTSQQRDETESRSDTRSKSTLFLSEKPNTASDGEANFLDANNDDEATGGSFMKAIQSTENTEFESLSSSDQFSSTDWLITLPNAAEKLTEYLSFLHENEQDQSFNFHKNPAESSKNALPVLTQKSEEEPQKHVESKPKNEPAEQADSVLQAKPTQVQSVTQQPLKNLKDFAQLFRPQEAGNSESKPSFFHQKNNSESILSPLPEQAANKNISDYFQPVAPNDFSQKNHLNPFPNNNPEFMAQPPNGPQTPQAPIPDIDDIMDELSQRLTKEYRRFYG